MYAHREHTTRLWRLWHSCTGISSFWAAADYCLVFCLAPMHCLPMLLHAAENSVVFSAPPPPKRPVAPEPKPSKSVEFNTTKVESKLGDVCFVEPTDGDLERIDDLVNEGTKVTLLYSLGSSLYKVETFYQMPGTTAHHTIITNNLQLDVIELCEYDGSESGDGGSTSSNVKHTTTFSSTTTGKGATGGSSTSTVTISSSGSPPVVITTTTSDP
eukprot:evm.model.scf_1315.1 EVM.evm.TU.scf_1315.1   scf_1315:12908-14141(-)